MEENLRRNVPSPSSSDPGPFDGCRTTELTWMSWDSSVVTVDSFGDYCSRHHCAAPFPLDLSTKWTDQQHSLYLNSLEASFANELHRSMRLRGWSLQDDSKEAFKYRTLQSSQILMKQFPVPRDGCSKKISLERNELVLQSTADSSLRTAPVERGCTTRESDLYDCGVLCEEGIQVRGISTFSKCSSRSLENHCGSHSCHLESVGCAAELTDQNFKDEDQAASSSCMPMAKRLKTVTADATSNDQVIFEITLVWFGKYQHRAVTSVGGGRGDNNRGGGGSDEDGV
ncbi:uncharacterized protein G2W53_003135 [Senna tora]|uniref:Uncharacterized protein n=1 Tax=Senna tora TaxID=362788 RepID=A0A834XAD9_9FABA|nr:uncharacterized protein G2W53_003135 [Senna tora]